MKSRNTEREKNLNKRFNPEIEAILLAAGQDLQEIYELREHEYRYAREESRAAKRLLVIQRQRILDCMVLAVKIKEVKSIIKEESWYDPETFFEEYFWISERTYQRYDKVRYYWADIEDFNPTSINHCLNLIKRMKDTLAYDESVEAKNKKTGAEAMNLQQTLLRLAEVEEKVISLEIERDTVVKELEAAKKEIEKLKAKDVSLKGQ